MKQWLISKIPTWILRRLVKRNFRLRQAHLISDMWYWADIQLFLHGEGICPDCYRTTDVGYECDYCHPLVLSPEKPVGVPEYLGKEHKPYGSILYGGVPFYYRPCFCDYTVGENCETCRPEGEPDD